MAGKRYEIDHSITGCVQCAFNTREAPLHCKLKNIRVHMNDPNIAHDKREEIGLINRSLVDCAHGESGVFRESKMPRRKFRLWE